MAEFLSVSVQPGVARFVCAFLQATLLVHLFRQGQHINDEVRVRQTARNPADRLSMDFTSRGLDENQRLASRASHTGLTPDKLIPHLNFIGQHNGRSNYSLNRTEVDEFLA